ncbi:phosphatidylinositol-3-phosphatase SAC1-like [Anopheles darlingi]|uniref:phosphatidylinositol-3-phosphatase SAC1-like n=1 Tax=Anopheles darlingi TaxID=43151 RepID=UPI0020FFFE54|nr:phosphatidylinositol-3-phosphatase SAC1-like [Anopheles darlingi]
MFGVPNDLVLHLTKERILIEASDYAAGQHLMIDRDSCVVTHVNDPFPNHPIWDCETRRVHGLLGIIPMPSGPHLLVITERVLVGTLFEKKIFRLGTVDLIPVASDNRDRKQDDYCRRTVLNLLEQPYFYFSYEYHLTHSMERISDVMGNVIKQIVNCNNLYGAADRRFVWNDALLSDWYQPSMRIFCLPLMHGFISINMLDPMLYPELRNHRPLGLVLISRRSRERAGTRLFTRGIDTEGHVANFVETEQIVVCGDLCISYVQTRGSIPLFWTQSPNLRFRPVPKLEPYADHLSACRQHLNDQCARYGSLLLVDLVDRSRETDAELSKAYESIVEQADNPDVEYTRKGLFDLVDSDYLNCYMGCIVRMFPFISNYRTQDCVIRTNCIDCIDRTNVFQSRVAVRVCARALFQLGIARDASDPLVTIFKRHCETAWIENANVLSRQYTGSDALKTDLTFRQSNSMLGYLRDAFNSFQRYQLNNFHDGVRQDAIDFFLRACIIPGQRLRAPRIFPEPPPILRMAEWIALSSCLIGTGASLLITQSYEKTRDNGSGGMLLILTYAYLAIKHPHLIVDMPQLEYRTLESAIEYKESE